VGFCCFVYAWFFLLRRSTDSSFSWRERISFLALILASSAAASRFVMPAFMPKANWGTGVGVAAQVHLEAVWRKIGVEAACVALILALIGRPRLIAPIATASLSIAFFWILSTIP